MTPAIVLLLLGVTWAAAGARLLATLDAQPKAPGDRLLASLSVGMVACGLVGEILAAAGALRPWPLAVAAAAALAVGAGPLRSAVAGLRLRLDGRTLAILAPAALGLLVVLLSFATPPVGGDQTKYQLAYPRLYARAGGLVPSSNVWGHQQFSQNFVYAVGYAAGGEFVARVLAAVTEILAAVAFGVLLERHLRRGLGLVAGVVFFTLPICWSQMARAGVDTGVTLFALLALIAVLDWRRSQRAGDLWRTGVMAGCAATCKVFGLLVPMLVGLVVLAELLVRPQAWNARLRSAIGYGALVLVVCVPFYVRNVVDTGNPIYPFGYNVLGGTDWSTEASDYLDYFFNEYQRFFAAKRGGEPYRGLGALRFPWDVTMYPESFERSARQTLDLGPLALAFLPAIVLVRRRRAAVWITAATGAAFTAIVVVAAWAHPRYVLPGVTLCLAAALVGARDLLGRRGFTVLVIGSIVGNLALTSKLLTMFPDQLRVLSGRTDTPTFMRKYSPRWAFWEKANGMVGADGRVMVFEKIIHPYYIDVPFVMASLVEQGWLDYHHMDSPDAIAAAAARLGISHVAVHVPQLTAAGDPFERRVGHLWTEFLDRRCVPVFERAEYRLYAVRPPANAEYPKARPRG